MRLGCSSDSRGRLWPREETPSRVTDTVRRWLRVSDTVSDLLLAFRFRGGKKKKKKQVGVAAETSAAEYFRILLNER